MEMLEQADLRRQSLPKVTTLQSIELMYVEACNELTKCKIMDRMFQRLTITHGNPQVMRMMGENQSRMKMTESTIKNLEDMHNDEFAIDQKKSNNDAEAIKSTKDATTV